MSDDYKVVCQLSGFVCLRSECRRRWDGLLVRADFWEPRHPQDFVKVPKESPPPKDATGEPPTQDLDMPPFVEPDSNQIMLLIPNQSTLLLMVV